MSPRGSRKADPPDRSARFLGRNKHEKTDLVRPHPEYPHLPLAGWPGAGRLIRLSNIRANPRALSESPRFAAARRTQSERACSAALQVGLHAWGRSQPRRPIHRAGLHPAHSGNRTGPGECPRNYLREIAWKRSGRCEWRPIHVFASGDFVILEKLPPRMIIVDFMRVGRNGMFADIGTSCSGTRSLTPIP